MLTKVINLHDVGMVQRCHQASLAAKPREQVSILGIDSPDHLQGYPAIECYLPSLIDDAHPARSNLIENLIFGFLLVVTIDRSFVCTAIPLLKIRKRLMQA